MIYTVAIHKDEDSEYGATVPDIPGCFSAGATFKETLHEVKEAILGHLAILAEDGSDIPVSNDVEEHQENEDYAGATWAAVEVDIAPFLGKTEKVNVSLPTLLSRKLARFGIANRSAFLAEAAAEKLAREYS